MIVRLRLLLILIFAWWIQLHAQEASKWPKFPLPDRPVAPTISAEYSDEKTRDQQREAERVMDYLGIRAGVWVADIGAGRGYYTIRVARRQGRARTIYATDVNPEYLRQLQARLEEERIDAVKLVLGAPRDPKLPPSSVDVAILAHVYHEIENPYEFMYRLWPSLAPGARVGIIEVDRPTETHGTPPSLLRCELGNVGYREVGLWSLKPADGYLMVFVPPQELAAVESITPCKAMTPRK